MPGRLSPTWVEKKVKFLPAHSRLNGVHVCCVNMKSQWSINCAVTTNVCLSFAFCFIQCKGKRPTCIKRPLYHLIDVMTAHNYWWSLYVDFEALVQLHTNIPGHESETILVAKQISQNVTKQKASKVFQWKWYEYEYINYIHFGLKLQFSCFANIVIL